MFERHRPMHCQCGLKQDQGGLKHKPQAPVSYRQEEMESYASASWHIFQCPCQKMKGQHKKDNVPRMEARAEEQNGFPAPEYGP
jgi:hypothetical protein